MVETFAVSLREFNNLGLIGKLLMPSLTRSISKRLFAIVLVIKNLGSNFAINQPLLCHYFATILPESQTRKELFSKYPLKTIYVSSTRINCAKNGDFKTYNSGAIAYAWYVWEKGYKGDTVVKWIN